MQLDFGQLFDNMLAILTIAFILQLSISALFTINFFQNMFSSALKENIGNLMILIASLIMVLHIQNLAVFYKIKIKINPILHMVLTTLLIARLTHLFRDLFQYLKERAGQEKF